MGYARKGSYVEVEHDAILAKIGANVRSRRERIGITQSDLAGRAGVDRAFLNRVELGTRNPTIVMLAKLANAMNTNVSALTRGV